jgi:hypothetical protein
MAVTYGEIQVNDRGVGGADSYVVRFRADRPA